MSIDGDGRELLHSVPAPRILYSDLAPPPPQKDFTCGPCLALLQSYKGTFGRLRHIASSAVLNKVLVLSQNCNNFLADLHCFGTFSSYFSRESNASQKHGNLPTYTQNLLHYFENSLKIG